MSIEVFKDADVAGAAVADAFVAQLTPPGLKHIVVTGGRTPGQAYDRMAQTDLDWSRVTITLSDERFVDPSSPDSNERLVRQRLLQGHAAKAQFVPLKGNGADPEADAVAAEPAIRALLPFDAVLLGMGDDGHIASLFPDAPGLAAALDPAHRTLVIGVVNANLEPHVPRISLTAAALFDTKLALILISGPAKRAVIERVAADPAYNPPVAALLRQTRAPVRVIWSP